MPCTLRGLRWPDDCTALLAFDTSFETEQVYRVRQQAMTAVLETTPVSPALRKRYDFAADVDHLPNFAYVGIAEVDARLVGVVAMRYEEWNRRAVLWHLYVQPDARGQGVGSALLAAATQAAEAWPARCLWLETQQVNYPAIQFYQRAGFQWCGFDSQLYDPADVPGEIALFFARAL